ncbi:MAG: hypothetical protein Q9N34_06380 [Aquificota bacterium]|nr:hypothetical protein [Aquificota bacterium]
MVLRAVHRFTRKTSTEIDDIVLRVVSRPASFLIVALGVFIALKILGLEIQVVYKVFKTFFIFVIGWTAYNLVVALEDQLYRFAERFGREFAKEIGGFLVKVSKVFVVVVGRSCCAPGMGDKRQRPYRLPRSRRSGFCPCG